MELVGSCVTALRHVTALRWKSEKKKGPRMSGSPVAMTYVVAWLPGARFLGARRGGHRSRRALGGAWLRRGAETTPVARSGWVIMDLFSTFGMFQAGRRLGMLRRARWMCMEMCCCHWI